MIAYPVIKKRRKNAAPRPPLLPNGLLITSVQTSIPPEQVKIFFAGPITWNGSDLPVAFRLYTSDNFFDSPINVIGSGPNWLEVEFNGSVSVGAEWQVDSLIAGIMPFIAYPQAGNVTA
jgi:hypothetical protein